MTIPWRLEVHAALGSTSDRCLAAAAAGEPAGLAVLALQQTAGRGSRGRAWHSPAGNMYLSFLLRPGGIIGEAGIWPLLISLALHDAVTPLLPDPSVLTLKWPNDLLLAGGKLAGILLDLAADAQGNVQSVVIGCGVNLAVAPDVPGRATASLRDAGVVPPSPEIFARVLLAALDARLAQHASAGAPALHAGWLLRAHPTGTALTIRYGRTEISGTFAGLSSAGHLLLQTTDGTKTIAAGEVLLASS